MTPVLILFFGYQPLVAIATDLVFATVTKTASALIHSKRGSVNWKAARDIWKGSIPGTLLGIGVVIFLGSQFDVALTLLLAVLLLFTSLSMLIKPRFRKELGNLGTAAGGVFIGFSVATTSVGAGALGMVLLRNKLGDRDPKVLVGTDVIHAIPIALIAGFSYFASGLINLPLLGLLLIGSIPGVLIGSLLTSRLNPNMLRRILALVLLVAAVSVLLKTIGAF
jgi:hypothetical protein